MSYGPIKTYNLATASGASSSSILDLSGKSYTQMSVYYNSMSTGALVSVYACDTSGGTFRPLSQLVPTTATVAYQLLQIPTSTSGNWTTFAAPPFQYLQFITSAVVSGGVSFTVVIAD